MKKEYFSLQIRRYKEEMFLLANSIVNNYHDAEDVVAETILIAYEKIHTLRDETKFKSWLMQILVNNAKRKLRSEISIFLQMKLKSIFHRKILLLKKCGNIFFR